MKKGKASVSPDRERQEREMQDFERRQREREPERERLQREREMQERQRREHDRDLKERERRERQEMATQKDLPSSPMGRQAGGEAPPLSAVLFPQGEPSEKGRLGGTEEIQMTQERLGEAIPERESTSKMERAEGREGFPTEERERARPTEEHEKLERERQEVRSGLEELGISQAGVERERPQEEHLPVSSGKGHSGPGQTESTEIEQPRGWLAEEVQGEPRTSKMSEEEESRRNFAAYRERRDREYPEAYEAPGRMESRRETGQDPSQSREPMSSLRSREEYSSSAPLFGTTKVRAGFKEQGFARGGFEKKQEGWQETRRTGGEEEGWEAEQETGDREEETPETQLTQEERESLVLRFHDVMQIIAEDPEYKKVFGFFLNSARTLEKEIRRMALAKSEYPEAVRDEWAGDANIIQAQKELRVCF